MKPFDLEAAKRGEPIRTRDGRSVKFIAHVPEAEEFRVLVLTEKSVGAFRDDGTLHKNSNSALDLFMAPKKRTVWVNLYSFGGGHAKYFETEEDASEAAQGVVAKRIGNRAYPVEIEE